MAVGDLTTLASAKEWLGLSDVTMTDNIMQRLITQLSATILGELQRASLISQIELGKIAPSVATLYTLTSFLGVSMDSLFVTDEEQDATPAIAPEQPASPTSSVRRGIPRISAFIWFHAAIALPPPLT